MELLTIGRNFYPGREILLFFNKNEDFKTYINSDDRLKLIVVEKGNGIININGRKEILTAPCVLCLNETDIVSLEKDSNVKSESFYFHPMVINSVISFENLRSQHDLSLTEIQDCSIFNPFIIRNGNYGGIINIDILTLQKIKQAISLVNRELSEQDNDFWPCKTRSYLYQLLVQINIICDNSLSSSASTIDVKNDDSEDIILFLHNNYSKKLTIEIITNELHINRNTLSKKIHEATGLTVMTYLNRLRIQKAAALLKDTNLLISEVCDKVGFADATNFGRAFKKYLGCSPSEYRNMKNA